jgi:uncharacterized protein
MGMMWTMTTPTEWSPHLAVRFMDSQHTMSRQVTVIIKVTNACNMKCRYCFIEPHVFHKTMSGETARRVIRVFLDSPWFEWVHMVWHGGEPLLRGRGFFEAILAEQQSRPTGVRFTNSLQTNATLLDETWLSFLSANSISIGLSLDGPRRLNDASRPMRNGMTGSAHDVTVRAAERLRTRGVSPGAIVVLNRANVEHPEEIYAEFKQRGMDIKVNPLSRSGLAATGDADSDITPEQYGEFMVRIFDAWFDDPQPTIHIEPIGQHMARILGVPGVVHACHFTRSCHRSFLGIAPDGDLYPCGMFQGEPQFSYGNINAMTPEEVAQTTLFGKIDAREARVLESCAKCPFLELCYGGCMFHSLKNAGRFAEKDYYCAGYKRYFEHMTRRIHTTLRNSTRIRKAHGGIDPGTRVSEAV